MRTKHKKICALVLIFCLALALAGCNIGQPINYDPDPDSITGQMIGAILNFLQGLTAAVGFPNYCVAIFLMTVIVKLLTHPLIVKQQQGVKNINVLQPKIKEINEKYANNPEKRQEATMKLYKEENINPMASCLPLLVQMPILMFLFWGMRNFIPDPAQAVHYNFFWIENLSVAVSTTPYPQLLPLFCALTTIVQQAVSMPSLRDKTQRIMLFVMPVMFYFISMQFPAALCLYWIFYGLITAVQTLYINYKLKIGLFGPAEEKRKSRITMAAEAYDKEQAAKSGKKDQAQIEQKKAEKEQQKQLHTHTHQESSGDKNLPDKPWH